MTTIKLGVAAAMALLLACTSLTQAAGQITPETTRSDNGGDLQTTGPGNGAPAPENTRGLPHNTDPGDRGGPDNGKPAPEFGTDDGVVIDTPVLKLSPMSLSCEYHGDHFQQSGAPEVWFKNIGTETIPKGSIITVTWPDGSKKSFKLGSDLKPGASVGVEGPASADEPGFHCGARVKVSQPLGVDDDVVVPRPILKIDPYVLTCGFWGGHDKFGPTVGFFNKGTKTIPAGSIITLTMPDGTTYEIKLSQNVPPGGGVAIDGPAYADQPGFTCEATITWFSARVL